MLRIQGPHASYDGMIYARDEAPWKVAWIWNQTHIKTDWLQIEYDKIGRHRNEKREALAAAHSLYTCLVVGENLNDSLAQKKSEKSKISTKKRKIENKKRPSCLLVVGCRQVQQRPWKRMCADAIDNETEIKAGQSTAARLMK